MNGWLIAGSIIALIACSIVREHSLFREIDHWREVAALWRDFRTAEKAANAEQSSWAYSEVERIRAALVEKGELYE